MNALLMECVRAAVVLVATAGVVVLLRNSSAARRHFAWSLGVAAVLVLPILTVALPSWEVVVPAIPTNASGDVDVSPFVNAAAVANTSSSPAQEHERSHTAVTPSSTVPLTSHNTSPVPARNTARATSIPSGTTSALPTSTAARHLSLMQALILLWATGFVTMFVYLLAGMIGAKRLVRSGRACEDARVLTALDEARAKLGVRRTVRLMLQRDAMPVTWGMARPVIVLPEAALAWKNEKLDVVFRHELAHIRRHDATLQLAAEVVRALHWYNPLAWLAASRMRVEREHACDDILLASGTRATDYANDLLGLATAFGGKRELAMAAVAMARPSSLRMRLVALLDEKRMRARVSTQFAVPSVIGMAMIVIPIASAFPVGRSTVMQTPPAATETSSRAPTGSRKATQNNDAAKRIQATLPPSHNLQSPRVQSPLVQSPLVQEPTSTMSSTISFTSSDNTAPSANVAASSANAAVQQERACLSRDGKGRSINVNNSDNEHYTIKYKSADCEGDVRVDGKLRYNSDYTRIVGLSNGGFMRIDETDHGVTRHLEARPSGDGLSYDWSVNGKSRPFDAEARAWLDNWTLVLFREMGFAAEDRATAMVNSGGIDAILREVGQMQSDYVQSIYLGVALEKGRPSNGDIERVLSVAASEIDSDYYMSEVLTHASKGMTFTNAAQQSYLKATARMQSDYYREEVLSNLLANGRLSNDQIAEVMRQAKLIQSDYYIATMLSNVASKYALDPAMRSAYMSAVGTIESDYYKLDVLHKLLAQKSLSDTDVISILTAGRTIGSDYYQSDLLQTVARRYDLKGAVRDAFMENMNKIASTYYRQSVQSVMRDR